jgi:hypothetical protein
MCLPVNLRFFERAPRQNVTVPITRFEGKMEAPSANSIAIAGEAPTQPPSICSPQLGAPPPLNKKGRKGQGPLQVAAAVIAQQELLLPQAPVVAAKRRGRPAKGGEIGGSAAPIHFIKILLEGSQLFCYFLAFLVLFPFVKI